MPTPYEVLGITEAATNKQIKAAYRKASQKAHPDKGGSDEQMQAINAAYKAIKDLKRGRVLPTQAAPQSMTLVAVHTPAAADQCAIEDCVLAGKHQAIHPESILILQSGAPESLQCIAFPALLCDDHYGHYHALTGPDLGPTRQQLYAMYRTWKWRHVPASDEVTTKVAQIIKMGQTMHLQKQP